MQLVILGLVRLKQQRHSQFDFLSSNRSFVKKDVINIVDQNSVSYDQSANEHYCS